MINNKKVQLQLWQTIASFKCYYKNGDQYYYIAFIGI